MPLVFSLASSGCCFVAENEAGARWPCTHTVIQEGQSHGNPALTSACWLLELSWLLLLEQPGCPHSRMWPCLGSFWLLVLHPPVADGHSGGCSQEQKASCEWQSSFPRVCVWHKLLPSMLWGLWAASCSRGEFPMAVAGSLPAPVSAQGCALAQVWSLD